MPQEAESTPRQAPLVVVLTGGPCAGKSSALAILRDRLSVRGFQVLTVPECATHFLANSDGFQPEWAGNSQQVAMQRIFFDYQIAQEEFFKDFARLHPSKPAVLLLDCCTLNSKVYVSDEQWEQVLAFPGRKAFTEEELFARYNLVIHLVTCAGHGNYEWGPGSNNPGRYHSPEQAKETDARSLEVFGAHPQLRVVPHSSDFEGKINKVLDFVNDALQIEGFSGNRRRCPVSAVDKNALLEVLHSPSSQCFATESCFVDAQMQHSVRRKAKISKNTWLERFHLPRRSFLTKEQEALDRQVEEFVLFERRAQVRCADDPAKSCLTRRVISEEEYNAALEATPGGAVSTTKYVLTFLVEGFYYELFFFPAGDDEAVLDSSDRTELPSWLRAKEAAAPQPAVQGVSVTVPEESTGTPPKRPRTLGRHTTEEAAHLFAAKKGRRNENVMVNTGVAVA